MAIEETLLLLPCHTLDDFPYYYEGVEADNILAGYSAMWHPALIACTGKTPSWQSSYNDDTTQLAGRLVVLPQVAENDLPGFWLDRARHDGAVVIPASDAITRDEIVIALLAALDEREGADDSSAGELATVDVADGDDLTPRDRSELDAELVKDFLALGLCHLLSELLTVQMRYASLVDQEYFDKQLVEAAHAAMRGDVELSREKLQNCFDAMAQSRDHFYPVDGYLIDLTLVEPSTIGEALRQDVSGGVVKNLLLTTETLDAMRETEPETLKAVRNAVEQGRVCLVGGDDGDEELSLLSGEGLIASLQRGGQQFESLVGRRPKVFGRRRFGLSPVLPQLLSKSGYLGALHFTLDGGRFAEPMQSKTIWEGVDGSTTDAFARLPIDTSKPETLLCLPQRLGDSMDMDHVAVVCFAHWPGEACSWYADLARIANLSPVLGKFVSLEQFLTETDTPRDHCHYSVDDYRSPYLRQAVATGRDDPLAASVERHETEAADYAEETVAGMAAVIGATSSDTDGMTALAAAICPSETNSGMGGYLVANPLSSPRRIALAVPELAHPPAVSSQIEAAYALGGKQEVLVEVPAFGYVWIQGDPSQSWQSPPGKLLAEDNVIRNEFAEVTIDRHTGAVAAVRCPGFRSNQLSQQLALRIPAAGGGYPSRGEASYSVMVADEVAVVSAGPITGTIESRGRLVDREGHAMAEFRQSISLVRNRPVLEFDVQIEPLERADFLRQSGVDPWDAYFASRVAWADSSSELFRSVAGGAHPTKLQQFEAPDFVEIRGAKFKASILTAGLPYHRRVDERTLDTLLVTGQEAARRFRFAIGLNLQQPHAAAQELSSPNMARYLADRTPPSATTGWLFHVNAGNVVVTRCEPVRAESSGGEAGQGGLAAVIGVRMRLMEVAGRSTSCAVRSVFPVGRGRVVDFTGAVVSELARRESPVDRDRVMIEMHPHQWSDLELFWEA